MKIEHIKLLRGHHDDTATTGQGCFMDVAAYLNGDAVITDESECVCFTARSLLISLNDEMNQWQREKMLPFLLRAVGSATTDERTIMRRIDLLMKFSTDQQKLCQDISEKIIDTGARRCADYTLNCLRLAEICRSQIIKEYSKAAAIEIIDLVAPIIIDSLMCAGNADYAERQKNEYLEIFWGTSAMRDPSYFFQNLQKITIERGLKLLDAMLPPADEPPPIVRERIDRLVTLNRSAALID